MMIGDRSHDMIGARNNGMTAVGSSTVTAVKEELLNAGAHHICATPQGLLDHAGSVCSQFDN
jgi:phosphoglycolate phosphatase